MLKALKKIFGLKELAPEAPEKFFDWPKVREGNLAQSLKGQGWVVEKSPGDGDSTSATPRGSDLAGKLKKIRTRGRGFVCGLHARCARKPHFVHETRHETTKRF